MRSLPLVLLLLPLTLGASNGVLSYATYLGGPATESAAAVMIDAAGNAVIAGSSGASSGFVTRLDPSGSHVLNTAAVPGTVVAAVLDADGNAVVAGIAADGGSGYVAKVSASGQVLFMNHFAASPSAVALDTQGNIYVTGAAGLGLDVTGGARAKAGVWNAAVTPRRGGGVRAAAPLAARLPDAAETLQGRPEWRASVEALHLGVALGGVGGPWQRELGGSRAMTLAGAGLQTTPGAFQTVPAGGADAFALKYSADGSKLVYATYLGGAGADAGRAIAVDSTGAAYIAGDTQSSNFPVTPGAAQSQLKGVVSAPGYGSYGDAFLAKLDPNGASLTYSTYYGGAGPDVAYAVAVDRSGNAYLAGATSSADFPVTAGVFQPRYAGPAADPTAPDPTGDAFLVKFGPLGGVAWSTYLGGSAADGATALTLDGAGNVYVAGVSESADFPRAGSFVPTCRTARGPFLAELDANGSVLLHSTGMSGMGFDAASAVALDSSARVYLAGTTTSQVFFATPGAAQTVYGGASDAFAARLDFSAPAGPFAACVLNGASFQPGNQSFFPLGTVAPGEIVSIFGASLGPDQPLGLQLTPAGTVATALGGTSVAFDGIAAPLIYAGPWQINAVVPYGIKPDATQMTVQRNGLVYGPVAMPAAAAVPAVFTYDGSGHGQAAVFNEDGTLNSIANPAPRGSVIVFYAAGAGLLTPLPGDGSVAPLSLPLPVPALPAAVTIRGVNAEVLYAGAAPGSIAGLLQVNARVPSTINFGSDVPLSLTLGTFASQLDLSIAIK